MAKRFVFRNPEQLKEIVELCKDGSAIMIKGQDVMFVISADKDAAVRAFRAVHSGRAGA